MCIPMIVSNDVIILNSNLQIQLREFRVCITSYLLHVERPSCLWLGIFRTCSQLQADGVVPCIPILLLPVGCLHQAKELVSKSKCSILADTDEAQQSI